MTMFIRDAGWGIYPVLFFGIVGLILALRHVVAPSKDKMALLVGLSVATVLMGILGTVTGLQATASHIGEVEQVGRIFLLGMAESLNNLVAALLFATAHTLIGSYGAYRTAAPTPAPRRA